MGRKNWREKRKTRWDGKRCWRNGKLNENNTKGKEQEGMVKNKKQGETEEKSYTVKKDEKRKKQNTGEERAEKRKPEHW